MSKHEFVIPNEPEELVATLRELVGQSPASGLARIEMGDPFVDLLWPIWRDPLEVAGIGRDQFHEIVKGYRNEFRLWVMGERPWEHCIEGLIGRIERRARTEAS